MAEKNYSWGCACLCRRGWGGYSLGKKKAQELVCCFCDENLSDKTYDGMNCTKMFRIESYILRIVQIWDFNEISYLKSF
jgi:hypothetical protein